MAEFRADLTSATFNGVDLTSYVAVEDDTRLSDLVGGAVGFGRWGLLVMASGRVVPMPPMRRCAWIRRPLQPYDPRDQRWRMVGPWVPFNRSHHAGPVNGFKLLGGDGLSLAGLIDRLGTRDRITRMHTLYRSRQQSKRRRR
jgi:hypothetical protein